MASSSMKEEELGDSSGEIYERVSIGNSSCNSSENVSSDPGSAKFFDNSQASTNIKDVNINHANNVHFGPKYFYNCNLGNGNMTVQDTSEGNSDFYLTFLCFQRVLTALTVLSALIRKHLLSFSLKLVYSSLLILHDFFRKDLLISHSAQRILHVGPLNIKPTRTSMFLRISERKVTHSIQCKRDYAGIVASRENEHIAFSKNIYNEISSH